MTKKKSILKRLASESVPMVLIGGLAMRIYNSPRITHDMDLVIRSLDIDKVITVMYKMGFHLAVSADEDNVEVCLDSEEASRWVENSKPGSMSFFRLDGEITSKKVSISSIDINSEIDFLYDVSIPFSRLKENALIFDLNTVTISVAAAEDLLYLKERRPDKSASDYADIEYLKNLQLTE